MFSIFLTLKNNFSFLAKSEINFGHRRIGVVYATSAETVHRA